MDDDIYGIKKWGDDILEVLNNGNVGLKNPFYPSNPSIDLIKIIESLKYSDFIQVFVMLICIRLIARWKNLTNSFGFA